MKKFVSLFAVLALFASPSFADGHADKPSIHASKMAVVSATVKAINHDTREVTLLREDGEEVSFVASENARNLEQVSVGDIVIAKYVESIDIEVIAVDDPKAEAMEEVISARAPEGDMPGGVIIDTVVVTAIVEEINLADNTFKLKGPEGNIKQYTARDPANLRKAAVGDLVVITLTEAIALRVEKKQ